MTIASRAAASAALCLGVFVPQADATPITRTFVFTARDFKPVLPLSLTPPADPVRGSVKVTFDPSGPTVIDSTAGIHLDSLSIALGSSIGFDYFPKSDSLYIGGMQYSPGGSSGSGVAGVASGTNDFLLTFLHASTSPSGANLYYSQSPVYAVFGAVAKVRVAAPEAPSWMIAALILSGMAFVRRRRVAPRG